MTWDTYLVASDSTLDVDADSTIELMEGEFPKAILRHPRFLLYIPMESQVADVAYLGIGFGSEMSRLFAPIKYESSRRLVFRSDDEYFERSCFANTTVVIPLHRWEPMVFIGGMGFASNDVSLTDQVAVSSIPHPIGLPDAMIRNIADRLVAVGGIQANESLITNCFELPEDLAINIKVTNQGTIALYPHDYIDMDSDGNCRLNVDNTGERDQDRSPFIINPLLLPGINARFNNHPESGPSMQLCDAESIFALHRI